MQLSGSRRMMWIAVLAVALVSWLGSTSEALAVPVGPGAFGPGAVVESFEGLAAGPNVATGALGPQYLIPGVAGPFAFASGVTLTSPIPNPLTLKNVLVGDWSLGTATWGLNANGTATATDVPSGTAYIASNSFAPSGPIELTLPGDVIRVGIYSTSFPGTVSLSAYDASGALLETVSTPSVAAAAWSSNFLGIEDLSGIRKVTISGSANMQVADDLIFESAAVSAPVPALSPAGVLLLGASLAFVGGVLQRQRRRR